MGRWSLPVAAVGGALAVGLGAFGAHALPRVMHRLSGDELSSALETWRTAASYHMVHAVALAIWSVWRTTLRGAVGDWPAYLFVAGVVLFSGSLYALVLFQAKSLAVATPFGGVLLILGWLTWARQAWRTSSTLPAQ